MTTAARIPDAALGALLLTLAVAIPRLYAEDAQAKTRLDALLQDAWETEKRENPPFATGTGDHRYDDRLQSVATVDLERRAAAARGYLERLGAIDVKALAPQDRVSYAMLERDLRDDLARHQFRTDRIPITADSGFHTGLSRLPQDMPLATVKDYENYIARLRAIPTFFDQHVEHMREGLKSGFTVARVALAGYDATMRPHAVADPEKSVFWKPFVKFPHVLDVLVEEGRDGSQPREIALVVLDVGERHVLGQPREAGVEAAVRRDRDAVGAEPVAREVVREVALEHRMADAVLRRERLDVDRLQALEVRAGRGRAALEVGGRDRLQLVVVAVVAGARREGRVLALVVLPGVLEQRVQAGLGLGVFRVQVGDRDGEGEEQRAERGVRDSGGRGHERGG